jgi:hypothetical protein
MNEDLKEQSRVGRLVPAEGTLATAETSAEAKHREHLQQQQRRRNSRRNIIGSGTVTE